VQRVFPNKTWPQIDAAFRSYCLKLHESQ
jgi:hypothetical protein